MKSTKLIITILIATAIAGCGKKITKVTKITQIKYYTPLDYKGYACKDLKSEIRFIGKEMRRVSSFIDDVKQRQNIDEFTDTLFSRPFSSPSPEERMTRIEAKKEYKMLRNRYSAVDGASKIKKCNFASE